MARAIRASALLALIVDSEKGFDPGKLDEGRMAHPPLGMPSPPASPIVAGSELFLQMSSCPTQPCQQSNAGRDRSRRLGRDGAHEHAPGPDDEAPVCVCHLPQAPNRARDGKPRLTKSALARREHGLGTD